MPARLGPRFLPFPTWRQNLGFLLALSLLALVSHGAIVAPLSDDLDAEVAREASLKSEFRAKLARTTPLEMLAGQRSAARAAAGPDTGRLEVTEVVAMVSATGLRIERLEVVDGEVVHALAHLRRARIRVSGSFAQHAAWAEAMAASDRPFAFEEATWSRGPRSTELVLDAVVALTWPMSADERAAQLKRDAKAKK